MIVNNIGALERERERESCIFQSTSREMQRDVLDNHRTLEFADM